jgi:protein O-mannosyl-transferase
VKIPTVVRGVAFWSVVIAALCVAVYANALRDGFVLDDKAAILYNEVVTGPFSLSRVFTSDFWGRTTQNHFTETYRPLTSLTFAIDWNLGGGKPWMFHLTNVLLHCVASVMVLRACWGRLGSNMASIATAAVFAVHTLHTDAVTSVVGRADVMALIAMGEVWAFHGRWMASVALFLGILAKESSLVALPLLVVRDLRAGISWREWPRRYVGYCVSIVAAVALRWPVLGGIRGSRRPEITRNLLVEASFPERVVTAVRTFGHAVELTMAPLDLIPDYGPSAMVPSTVLDEEVVLGATVMIVLVAIIVWAWRQRHFFGDAAVWMLLCGLATANAPFLLPRSFAERWWYLASAGACVLFGAALARLRHRVGAPAMLGVAVPVVAVLSVLTVRHNEIWIDERALFRDAVTVEPRVALAQIAVAEFEMTTGGSAEGYARCTLATEQSPRSSEAWGCLAHAAEMLGHDREATAHYAHMMRGEVVSLDRRVQHIRFLLRTNPQEGERLLAEIQTEQVWSERGRAMLEQVRRTHRRH